MEPAAAAVEVEGAQYTQSQDDESQRQKKVKFSWGSLVSLNPAYPHQGTSRRSPSIPPTAALTTWR